MRNCGMKLPMVLMDMFLTPSMITTVSLPLLASQNRRPELVAASHLPTVPSLRPFQQLVQMSARVATPSLALLCSGCSASDEEAWHGSLAVGFGMLVVGALILLVRQGREYMERYDQAGPVLAALDEQSMNYREQARKFLQSWQVREHYPQAALTHELAHEFRNAFAGSESGALLASGLQLAGILHRQGPSSQPIAMGVLDLLIGYVRIEAEEIAVSEATRVRDLFWLSMLKYSVMDGVPLGRLADEYAKDLNYFVKVSLPATTSATHAYKQWIESLEGQSSSALGLSTLPLFRGFCSDVMTHLDARVRNIRRQQALQAMLDQLMH